MLLIKNIKLGIDEDQRQSLSKAVQKRLFLNASVPYRIYKKSIDARKKDRITFVYQVTVEGVPIKNKKKWKDVSVMEPLSDLRERKLNSPSDSVLIVGAGPAGLFAALLFSHFGYSTTLLERGKPIFERSEDVESFWAGGELNPESNVQFGLGGAGTFSDGKLTSRSDHPLGHLVSQLFVEHGAPQEILYEQYPHIGTDILRTVVSNMAQSIRNNGASIHYNTRMDELIIKDGQAIGVNTPNGPYYADHIVLALGNSARESFRMLHEKGVAMESKPLAVGFRIEHPQLDINHHQYGDAWNHPRLGAANYRLTHRSKEEERGVYTFCMCPGGRVVSATSVLEHLVVNGMSYHQRDLTNANSAVIANISPRDYGEGVLAAMEYQEMIEKKAFQLGGGNYSAPVQRVEDFILKRKTQALGTVLPSYTPGVCLADLSRLYSPSITEALREALVAFERKLKPFGNPDAILTGVETRTSSPVRILRDPETMVSLNIKNLYPIGEGAGYAGGITSSAIDGLRLVETMTRSDEANNI